MATVAEIRATVLEYANYAEANDVSRARTYQTAITQLITNPEEISRGSDGDKLRWDMETMLAMLKRVDDWLLKANSAAARAAQLNGGFSTMSARRTC